MKKVCLCFLLLINAPALCEEFLVGFQDIPVMPGLNSAAVPDVEFDTPLGRIVEVYASGQVTRAAVNKYYAATLPALGWEQQTNNVYMREDERFTLDFFGTDGALAIRFTLAPQ